MVGEWVGIDCERQRGGRQECLGSGMGGLSFVGILCPCGNHPRQFSDCAARIMREMEQRRRCPNEEGKHKGFLANVLVLEFFVRNGNRLTPLVLGRCLPLLGAKPHSHILAERKQLASTRTADQAQL